MGYGRGGGGAENEKSSAKADFVVLDEVAGPGMCFLSLPLAPFLCDKSVIKTLDVQMMRRNEL